MSETDELDPRFMELASRFIDGEASPEDLGGLDALLKSQPRARIALTELLNQHGTLALSLRGEAAYREQLAGLAAVGVPKAAARPPSRRSWWMAVPIAACVAIIATVTLYQGQRPISKTRPARVVPVTISFQDGLFPTPGYRGTRDTRINEHRPLQRYGKDAVLEIEGGDREGYSVLLLRWDLTAIPPGSRIHAAEFSFTFSKVRERDSRYRIWELRRDWSEEEATWNQAARETPWNLAGAKGAPDRGTEIVAEFAPRKGSLAIPLGSGALRTIERWVSSPVENHGVLVALATDAGEFYFASREAEAASSRPKLTISYSPPEK